MSRDSEIRIGGTCQVAHTDFYFGHREERRRLVLSEYPLGAHALCDERM
jgi:hypothetical protein